MFRSWHALAAGAVVVVFAACHSPQKPSSQVRYDRPPPSGKFTYIDVKRYRPEEIAQIPRGARCTVETKDTNRSVTGYVQQAGPEGIVLVNAEEIVAKTEFPSDMQGHGYDHKAKDKVTLAAGEVASVRVFKQ